MNIFYKITVRSLWKNKTRTSVTIIGIILSAALITGVAVFVSSLQDYLIRSTIADKGNWHVAFFVPGSRVGELSSEPEVKKAFVVRHIGDIVMELPDDNDYHELPKGINAISDGITNEIPVKITEGRLPSSEIELLIPRRLQSIYAIGQTYAFTLGKTATPIPTDPDDPSQGSVGWEIAEPTGIKDYTIVGYYSGLFIDSSDLFLTWMEKPENAKLSENENYTLVLQLKNPAKTQAFINRHDDLTPHKNDDLLRGYGVLTRDSFMTAYYLLAAILTFTIMVGSVSLIHNAFAISVAERSRQFGILSSVGATRKQLTASVVYEGAIVAAAGIPLGVLFGILGIGVTLHFVGDMLIGARRSAVPLTLCVSAEAIIVAVSVSLLTILISAHIPAARASKISAIDAIRQSGDIKISENKVRIGWITEKLFGIEGTLAMKSFKRNGKRYRSTIFSLFISIVIFISAASLGLYLGMGQEVALTASNYDIFYNVPLELAETKEDFLKLYEQMRSEENVTNGLWVLDTSSYIKSPQSVYSEKMWEEERKNYSADMPDDVGSIGVAFMPDEAFGEYLRDLGLPPSEFMGADATRTIASSKGRQMYGEGGRVEQYDVYADTSKPIEITFLNWRDVLDDVPGYGEEYPLVITDFIERLPDFKSHLTSVDIILPESRMEQFAYANEGLSPFFVFTSKKPELTCARFEEILSGMGQPPTETGKHLVNIDAQGDSSRDLILVINIFTYGFTALISLIAVANVFNTIFTGIRLRRRELAMLKSIGLGDVSFGRMMNYECLFYGLKALLYGLPVAGLVTYAIYSAMNRGIEVPFALPLTEICVAIIGVFAVVFSSMLYSTRRIKKENIIDALRDEMT